MEKKKFFRTTRIITLIAFLATVATAFAADVNIVYLKNGNKVRGEIIDQITDKSVTLETMDGSIFVFDLNDVEKITKVKAAESNPENIGKVVSPQSASSSSQPTSSPKKEVTEQTNQNPLTYDEGVVINGVKWATRNVDAPGTFAEKPESSGMFYKWNSKIGWSVTDPKASTNGSSWDSEWKGGKKTTVWEKSNNPCPAGWRVPTLSEINSIFKGNKWKKLWTTTPAEGCIFRNSDGEGVFFPAAGALNYKNGAFDGVGSNGCYWSSTKYDSSTAHYLFICNLFPTSVQAERSNGFCVRCVSDE